MINSSNSLKTVHIDEVRFSEIIIINNNNNNNNDNDKFFQFLKTVNITKLKIFQPQVFDAQMPSTKVIGQFETYLIMIQLLCTHIEQDIISILIQIKLLVHLQ